ncbi:hypothetical protein BH23BAC4_BH23BAC4_11960 [soil metagenome]
MPRSFLAALLLFAVTASIPTAEAQAPANSGFSLYGLAPSARAAALAGAFGATYGNDPVALYYNPALLNPEMQDQISVGYLNHFADINAGSVTYARSVPVVGTVAGGIRLLSYGSFDRAGEDGTRDGDSFSAGDIALTVSAARPLGGDFGERVRVGASVHLAQSRIDDQSAGALSLDLGAAYIDAESGLVVSASIHHLGTVFSSIGQTGDQLPFDARLAVSKRLERLPLTLNVTGYQLTNFEDRGDRSAVASIMRHLAFGGELSLGTAVALRAGLNPRLRQEISGGSGLDLGGVSLGFGINVRNIQFDYAYASWSEVGGLHHLTVRTGL